MSRASHLAAFLPSHVEKLNVFLRSAKSAALSKQYERLHVVMGNEACDADSMVSSLMHAFARKRQTPNDSTTIILPVMSVNRNQFRLRCETRALFEAAQIDMDALIFQDEIDLPSIHSNNQLELTLTDHNKLKHAYSELDTAVQEIHDHHEDLGFYRHVSGSKRNIAFKRNETGGEVLAGSCCTLIAEEIVKSSDISPLDATLLLAVILLDNMNMDPKMKKGTPRDFSMLAALEPISLIPRTALYEWLVFEKFNPENWKSFTFSNCLEYDYKQFDSAGVSYGCSSILVDLNTFWILGGRDAFAHFDEHRSSKNLSFVVVQSMIQSGPRRQLLVYAPDSALHKALQVYLESTEVLQLAPIHTDDRLQCYEQHNVALSRKQLVPLLDTFLKQYHSQL